MQFFAFCPRITAEQCGVVNSGSGDTLTFEAGLEKKTINLSGDQALQQVDGGPNDRKYQSCYYEIKLGSINPKDNIERFNNAKNRIFI